MKHNLLQAQREIESGRAELDVSRREGAEALEQVRRSYEQSRSWQLTEPLRAAGRWVRARRHPPGPSSAVCRIAQRRC